MHLNSNTEGTHLILVQRSDRVFLLDTGLGMKNMDVWVHSSMAGLFLFWKDFKEIFPILLTIVVFIILPVIYIMFKRRMKKRENAEEGL